MTVISTHTAGQRGISVSQTNVWSLYVRLTVTYPTADCGLIEKKYQN